MRPPIYRASLLASLSLAVWCSTALAATNTYSATTGNTTGAGTTAPSAAIGATPPTDAAADGSAAVSATRTMTTLHPVDASDIDRLIENWPDKVKEAVRATAAKYGPPNEIGMHEVMWHNEDLTNTKMNPIKHSHIKKQEVPHHFPMPHTDFYKQIINYRVPADKADELAAYDGSVTFNRTKGEMSAMCDREEMNLLAFNLAHDVVTGKRSVTEARQFYADTAMAFKNGQKPDYTQRLTFEPPKTGAADPDQQVSARK